MPEKFPNIMKHKFTDSRSSMNPKQNKWVHHIKPHEDQILRENLERIQKKITHWRKIIYLTIDFSSQKEIYLKCWNIRKRKYISIHLATLTLRKLLKVKGGLPISSFPSKEFGSHHSILSTSKPWANWKNNSFCIHKVRAQGKLLHARLERQRWIQGAKA